MRMIHGVITPDGSTAGHVHTSAETPTIGGMPVTGVYGISPANHSGSLYAVRSPMFTLTEDVMLRVHLDWATVAYAGDPYADDLPVLDAMIWIHSQGDEMNPRLGRKGSYEAASANPAVPGSGNSLMGLIAVEAGTYYVSGSFSGNGEALPASYQVGGDQGVALSVEPMKLSLATPAVVLQRAGTIVTAFDASTGNVDATVVWNEDDQFVTIPQGAAAGYIHNDQPNATVSIVVSDQYGATGGTVVSANPAVTWSLVPPTHTWASINPALTWAAALLVTDV